MVLKTELRKNTVHTIKSITFRLSGSLTAIFAERIPLNILCGFGTHWRSYKHGHKYKPGCVICGGRFVKIHFTTNNDGWERGKELFVTMGSVQLKRVLKYIKKTFLDCYFFYL